MSNSDSIGDMLTIIRNGSGVGFPDVKIPFSKLKQGLLNVLKREGYIQEVESIQDGDNKFYLKVKLKYGPNGEKLTNHIERVSKPGRRVYMEKARIPRIKYGFGTVILTTSKGILSGREARLQKTGGEVLCKVW
jgi:small subunit ribosomal protein S8